MLDVTNLLPKFHTPGLILHHLPPEIMVRAESEAAYF